MLSLLLPVYNEEQVIEDTVRRLHAILTELNEAFEIIVIDDGSTDRTPEILKELCLSRLTVIRHPKNTGYGASLKTGIRHSQGDLIGITDADGTYPLEEFPQFLSTLREAKADMVIGSRTKRGAQIPLLRRPAKFIVSLLANILAQQKIPDLNSGMRVFTRELAERFLHLYPQRFSFTATLTLAALTNDYLVHFLPIDYYRRQGRSTLAQGLGGLRNFAYFLGLVIRIMTYFKPLRFFVWPSTLLLLAGIGTIFYTITVQSNISDAGLLLLLTGLQIGLFGLLADVVARERSAGSL